MLFGEQDDHSWGLSNSKTKHIRSTRVFINPPVLWFSEWTRAHLWITNWYISHHLKSGPFKWIQQVKKKKPLSPAIICGVLQIQSTKFSLENIDWLQFLSSFSSSIHFLRSCIDSLTNSTVLPQWYFFYDSYIVCETLSLRSLYIFFREFYKKKTWPPKKTCTPSDRAEIKMERKKKNQDFIRDFSVIFTKCNLNKTFRTISEGVICDCQQCTVFDRWTPRREILKFHIYNRSAIVELLQLRWRTKKEPETLEPKFILLY